MKRKSLWRRALLILLGVVVLALAVRMVIRFADAQISYSDEAADIELVAPKTPPPPATTLEIAVGRNPSA